MLSRWKRPVADGCKWRGTEKGSCLLSSAEPGSGAAADSSPYTSLCPTERGMEEVLRRTMRNTLTSKCTRWNNGQLWARYLILIVQDNTEDLCAVPLLDAGPPSNREDVMILGGVAVIREGLLCERETIKALKERKYRHLFCCSELLLNHLN